MSTVGLVVYRGRPFVKQDYSSPDKVVLLDENAAETLFTDGDPVGGTIEISGEPFTVIGLYRKSSTFQPTINSISDYQTYYQQEYGTVLMPDTDWPIVYAYDEPVNCVVRAKSVKDMSAVGKNAAEIMNECISSDQSDLSYNAEDLVEKAKSAGFSTVSSIIADVFPLCYTSYSSSDILKLATQVFDYSIEKTSGFPFAHLENDVTVGDNTYDCVVPVTLEQNVKELHSFLFGDKNYEPTETVKEYSQDLIDLSGYGEDSIETAKENSVISGSGGEADSVK